MSSHTENGSRSARKLTTQREKVIADEVSLHTSGAIPKCVTVQKAGVTTVFELYSRETRMDYGIGVLTDTNTMLDV